MTQLKAGDKAPGFKLLDQHEARRSLADFKGKKLLVYFYPKAMTSGCAVQSVNVSEAQKEFRKLGVEVVGISPDAPDRQKKFDEKKAAAELVMQRSISEMRASLRRSHRFAQSSSPEFMYLITRRLTSRVRGEGRL